MDHYKKFILNIIINRGRFAIPDGEYKERHHIIPQCMGGSDDEENLVDLLLREHIVAHKLLADIYPSCGDVQYAFWMMCNCREYDDVVTPAEYEEARKRFQGENNPMKRPEVVEKNAKARRKPVEAIDPETGQRELFFKSTHDAGRAGFDQSHVTKCCNRKPNYKTHKGYIWRYVEGGDNDDGDN